jgi:hypothetical protein
MAWNVLLLLGCWLRWEWRCGACWRAGRIVFFIPHNFFEMASMLFPKSKLRCIFTMR